MKAGRFFSKHSFVHCLAIIAASALAAACGDSDDAVGDASAHLLPPGIGGSGGSSAGVILAIGGAPPAQILTGVPFSFAPTVNNPNGFDLTYSGSNLPSWVTFNSSTGAISGTPGPGDVGTYVGIRITVSGGGVSDTTRSFAVEVAAVANGSATLSWVPPTTYVDGRALDSLAGYRIYYGQSQGSLTQTVTIANPGLTNYIIENLTPATWYFRATAYDSSGAESSFSNIASKTIM